MPAVFVPLQWGEQLFAPLSRLFDPIGGLPKEAPVEAGVRCRVIASSVSRTRLHP
jgi:hypothetical protein